MSKRSHRSSELAEPEAFKERVSSKLGDAALNVEVRERQIWFETTAERAAEVARVLKEDPDLDFEYFNFLSAIDWEEEGFEILVMLFSLGASMSACFRVRLPADAPSFPSLTGVYQGADWHERECSEMFGIDFPGHPNLKNLYLSDDFEGHPLRKSFRLASRTFKPWPGAKDPAEAEAGGR